MAVDSSSGIDSGVLAMLSQNKEGMGFNSLLGIAALRLLMPNAWGTDGGARPLTANDVQNIVNDSQAAATANSNFGILLKDIQDTGQDITGTITANSNTLNQNILQGQIATLQSQAAVLAGIEAGKSVIVNETHELGTDLSNVISSGNQMLSNSLNTINTNMLQGFNGVQTAIAAEGTATRALVTDLNTKNLERELTVAQSRLLQNDTASLIRQGNVEVTTNVNQNQTQAQQQQQLNSLLLAVNGLATHQQAMATAINVGGYQRANQTPTNISQ